jgi:hypothetical protein
MPGDPSCEPIVNPPPEDTCKTGNCVVEPSDSVKLPLGLTRGVLITYKDRAAAEVAKTYGDTVTVEVSQGHVTLKSAKEISGGMNIILGGATTNGSLKLYGDEKIKGGVTLYMNGVRITNPDAPAINIQQTSGNAGKVTVNLVKGMTNALNGKGIDKDENAPEQAKGAFFSEAAIIFSGAGSLDVKSGHRHAIVVDNSLDIKEGSVTVSESKDGDGIHANREISISGGTLKITSFGDAIQNEREYPINISGGTLTLTTAGDKSHGVTSDSGDVNVSGNAKIKITLSGKASKGLKSKNNVTISGTAEVDVEAKGDILVNDDEDGDEDNTSSSAGIKANTDFKMSGGKLTVTGTGENSKGMNIAGDAEITGGDVKITSNGFAVKVDGKLTISGSGTKVSLTSTGKKHAIKCDDQDIKITISQKP